MSGHGGNTGLHEAVRNSEYDMVKLLLEEDPEMAHGKDSDGKSPLYIAAEKGDHGIVELILRLSKSPSYDGPDEKTALHAAALNNSADCMKQMLVEMHLSAAEKVDVFGLTALHYTAKFGYKELVNILLSKHKSLAYIAARNGESETALHLAVARGHLDVVKETLLHCPDCLELTDGKGKNALHLAVENEQKHVLEFLLDGPLACELMDESDENGNTPLHLYTATKSLDGQSLVKHPCIDLNVFNNDNMTPLDMAMNTDEATERQILIVDELVKAGATPGLRDVSGKSSRASLQTNIAPEFVKNILTKKPLSKVQVLINGLEGAGERAVKDSYTKTRLVVAALIITVSFAAGFTVPGGFDDTEGKVGMAIHYKRKAFIAFVVTNSMAFLFSTAEVLNVIFMRDLLDKKGPPLGCFLIVSMPLMELAFSTGLYVTLQDTAGLKMFVVVIGSVVAFMTYYALGVTNADNLLDLIACRIRFG